MTTRDEIISFCDGRLRTAFDGLPPDIAALTQADLEKQRKPTETDYFLREKLWDAVENAKKLGNTSVTTTSVHNGVCSKQGFDRVLVSPLRLAWLLTYPNPDKERMRAGLSLGLTHLIEFVSNPPNDDNAAAWMKAIEFLTNRVHGPVIQRIEAKHAHLNLNKPLAAPLKEKDLRLDELRTKLAPARDVSPKPEDS